LRQLEEKWHKSEAKIKVLVEEVEEWRKNFEWTNEALNKINDEANDLEAKLEETKEDKTRLESELELTKCKLLEASQLASPQDDDVNQLKQLITDLQDKLKYHDNLVQTLRAEVAKKDEEMVAQEQLMDKLEAEHKARMALERAVQEKEADNAALKRRQEAANVNSAAGDDEVDRVRQQLTEEQQHSKELEAETKQFEDKAKYWLEEAEDWKKKFQWANETLDKINDEANDLEAKLEAANEVKDRLESELAAEKKKKTATSEREHELEKELGRVREKLGTMNVKYADLKVDVDREELELQKRCKTLQEDLDYARKNVEHERQHVARLTNSLRIVQNEKMETTVLSTSSSSSSRRNKTDAATNTEQSCQSPQWSSGPGYLKEVRLYELEHKTRRLERENDELKTSEDWLKKRGSQWKTKARKYEEQLIEAGVKYTKVDFDAPRVTTKEVVKENCRPTDNVDDLDLELVKHVPPRDLYLKKTDRREQPNDCKTQ